MHVRSALSLLLLPLLVVSTVGAQGVYVTDVLVTAPPNGTVVYEGSDVAPSGEPTKAYLATGTPGATFTTQWDYAVTEAFTASGLLTLTYYIACDDQTVIRPGADGATSSARAFLGKGGTTFVEGNVFSVRTCDGPSDVWEAVFELDGGNTAFAPGDVLNLQLLVWAPNGAPGTGAENLHVLVGDAFPSGLTGDGLPGGAVAAPAEVAPVYQDLATPEALVEHDWATSRNTTFVYNWTAPDGDVVLDLGVAPSRGNATVAVVGADGSELHNATYGGATNETVELPGGNWTLTVAYDDFVGTLRLHAAAAEPEPEPEPEADGNSTMEPAPEAEDATAGDNESPGVPAVAALAVLGVAVAAVRRRGRD